MFLRRLENSPEKMIPAAMALIVVGLSLLTIGITWLRVSPSIPHLGTDWNDFFRGMIFGIAIVLEIAGVVLATKAAAAKNRKAQQNPAADSIQFATALSILLLTESEMSSGNFLKKLPPCVIMAMLTSESKAL